MPSLVGLDFETYYDTSAGYSLKKLTTEEYIRHPLFEVIGFSLKEDNQPAQWFSGDLQYTYDVLSKVPWHRVAQVAHNNRFDAGILNMKFGMRPKKYICTMSMAMGLFGLRERVSLEKMAEHLQLSRRKGDEVKHADGKRRLDFNPAELHRYGMYCVDDTEIAVEGFAAMMPHTLPTELQLIDWTIRSFVEPQLVLDGDVLREELAAYHARKDDFLRKCGIPDITLLRSDNQFAAYLMQLGVSPPVKESPKQKNPDGTPKMLWAFSKQDIPFMELLLDEDEDVVNLVEARLGAKTSQVQTRLERLIGISQRGPMPMPHVYCGATPTRRWAGDDKVNVQNFPRNKYTKPADGSKPQVIYSPLRRAITAPPGKRMASADLSQIELRVNAWQSGQTDVLDVLRAGGDVYCDQASELYNRQITKADPLERFVGKTTELQCGYQCGPDKFLHSLKVAAKRDGFQLQDDSLMFAQNVIDTYRRKRAKIKQFWYTAGNHLQSIAYGMTGNIGPYPVKDFKVWLPNGSHLYYPDLAYKEKIKEGEQGCEWVYQRIKDGRRIWKKIYGGLLVENITQAVARLFVSDALLRLETIKDQAGNRVFDVVFMVHDELVVLFDETLDEKWVRDCLTWAMTTNPVWAPDLPLECEVNFGQHYGECK